MWFLARVGSDEGLCLFCREDRPRVGIVRVRRGRVPSAARRESQRAYYHRHKERILEGVNRRRAAAREASAARILGCESN